MHLLIPTGVRWARSGGSFVRDYLRRAGIALAIGLLLLARLLL
jgi:hypothetical protein